MPIPALSHFLDIESLSAAQLWGLMHLARELKAERARIGHNLPILEHKSLALLFQKPSLRTRVSFEMGMQHLGGHAFYIAPTEVGLGTRESVPDVARVLSGYCDGIMARVFAHDHILQLAEWGTVPVINGLSDFSHPCQALADLFTIWEHFGTLEGLTLVYVGDGSNNVATSLIQATAKVGMPMRVVAPPAYQPDPALLNGRSVTVTDDLDGVVGADLIYTIRGRAWAKRPRRPSAARSSRLIRSMTRSWRTRATPTCACSTACPRIGARRSPTRCWMGGIAWRSPKRITGSMPKRRF